MTFDDDNKINSDIYHKYGDKYQSLIIAITSVLIILSFIGVGLLWSYYSNDCNHIEYTYCSFETKDHTTDH